MKTFITFCLFGLSLLPNLALSCACCADHGEWFSQTNTFEDWQLKSLNQLKFANRAELFLAEHVPEIKGISISLRNLYSFELKMIRNHRDWIMHLKAIGGTGVLRFRIPEKNELFRVDLKDNPAQGHGPKLYKETRFNGNIRGEGIFKMSPHSDARYKLILQAKGGLCNVNEEYKSWILVVDGTHSAFTLHGNFER